MDPIVPQLGEVLWIVDLNRQSLDRVVPDIAAGRIAAMFEAAGWQTITVKYGRRLRRAVRARRRRGAARAHRRDAQRGVPAAAAHARRRAARAAAGRRLGATSRGCVADLDDDELAARAARPRRPRPRRPARRVRARPTRRPTGPSVIFAYTIKAWRLPTEGHPANHSALLTAEQWEQLAAELGADAGDPWARSAAGSPEAALCRAAAERLQREPLPRRDAARGAGRRRARARGNASTQQAFGRFFVDLAHERARGRRPRRHGQPRRRVLDEPRRLDQPRRRLVRSATASTGSPTTPTRSCAGARPSTASTSSWASPRATSSACWASWARRGRATASRCCRSARCTTRSSTARWSRGRSACTRAASRSSSARRRA